MDRGQKYLREPNPHPEWDEAYCTESTALIGIAREYFLGAMTC